MHLIRIEQGSRVVRQSAYPWTRRRLTPEGLGQIDRRRPAGVFNLSHPDHRLSLNESCPARETTRSAVDRAESAPSYPRPLTSRRRAVRPHSRRTPRVPAGHREVHPVRVAASGTTLFDVLLCDPFDIE